MASIQTVKCELLRNAIFYCSYVLYLTFYKEKNEMFVLRRHETLNSQQDSKKTSISQEAVKNNNR